VHAGQVAVQHHDVIAGDIAPAVSGAAGIGATITQTLVGTFAGLIMVVVVGMMFITAEYRRGLIRTTLAAGPRRGRVLAAKAIVIGSVTSVVGLAAAAVVVTLGQRVLRGNGVYVHAVPSLTELRVVAGTAALFALAVSAAAAAAVTCPSGAAPWTPPSAASPASTLVRRWWPSWPCWRSAASTATA
jgi:hypothetical protein